MPRYEICLTDSLEKVLPGVRPRPMTGNRLLAFGGETVSFQLAALALRDTVGNRDTLTVTLDGEWADKIRARKVELEPVMLACHGAADENYLTKTAAMLPDPLVPFAKDEPVSICLLGDQWAALWFDFTVPAGTPAGESTLTLTLTDGLGAVVSVQTLTIAVRAEALPPQTLLHTEWFHCDCLADYYHVPVWSEEHWRIVENFMQAAADMGINMLLTPLFTPPLDTWVGGERPTNQLIGVTVTDGEYSFDFALLDRWIDACRRHGITNLELSHLFTQWGAAAAPKVVATVDGVEKRIFGWDTSAVGGEYTRFLRCFIPQLKAHLAGRDMLDHSWFHISDEPNEKNMEQWNAARCSIADLLEGCNLIDALSSFKLYENGFIRTPVVSENHIEPFVEAKVPGLWTYYCCGQGVDVPNRFLAMPSARTRMLGTLLYTYDLAGFLQWGFNFYYGERSRYKVDPWRNCDGYGVWQSGDPFVVYPAADGSACESLRAAVIREAMQDLRLLRLAETKLGRDAVMAILESSWDSGKLTMKHYPHDPAWFDKIRSAICAAFDK